MARFRKQLLIPGTHVSPDGEVRVDDARIRRWCDLYARMSKDGIRVPAAWGHQPSAYPVEPIGKKFSHLATEADYQHAMGAYNAGYLSGAGLYRDKDGSLWLEGDAPGVEVDADGNLTHWVQMPDGRKVKAAIGEVSAGIADWRDGKGRLWKDAIVHVALTPLPVVAGQKGFERMGTAGFRGTCLSTLTNRDTLQRMICSGGKCKMVAESKLKALNSPPWVRLAAFDPSQWLPSQSKRGPTKGQSIMRHRSTGATMSVREYTKKAAGVYRRKKERKGTAQGGAAFENEKQASLKAGAESGARKGQTAQDDVDEFTLPEKLTLPKFEQPHQARGQARHENTYAMNRAEEARQSKGGDNKITHVALQSSSAARQATNAADTYDGPANVEAFKAHRKAAADHLVAIRNKDLPENVRQLHTQAFQHHVAASESHKAAVDLLQKEESPKEKPGFWGRLRKKVGLSNVPSWEREAQQRRAAKVKKIPATT